jgi:hypothetical protein
MATRGSIPEMMRRAGIEMLEPADGVPVLRRLLTAGFSGEAVVGRKLGLLLSSRADHGGLDPQALARAAAARRLALPIARAALDLHVGLEVDIEIDPRTAPFLHDHAIDGTPVLPGVMGLEAFAEVAGLLAPGHHVVAIEEVGFHAPLKYFRGQPRAMTVRALARRAADGTLRVRAALGSTQALHGQAAVDRLHFTATVVLSPDRPAPPARDAAPGAADDRGPALARDQIYRVYFHGPAYQVLARAWRTEEGVGGDLAADLPRELPADAGDAGCVFAPRLVELCFQTAGVWEIGATGQLGLPSAVDRVSVWPPPAGAALVAEIVPRDGDGTTRFDAVVRDAAGRVYVEVEGYRTSALPGSLPADQLAPFRDILRPPGA